MPSFLVPYVIGGAAVLLAVGGLVYYGHTRYLDGVEHAKTEIIRDIANSKNLKDAEARKASAAARDAARRVCEQYKLSPEACDEF